MKVLALNGSHHTDGNTAFLLNEVLKHCSELGADTEIISVTDAVNSAKYPFCLACSAPCSKQCYKDTMLDEAFKKVEEADFILFGSPVYFGSMSGQLKCFFDKTKDPRARKAWLDKPCAAISVGFSKYGGQERTIEAIHSCALVSGMRVIGNSSEISMGHFGLSAQHPASDDTYAITQAKSLAKRIIDTIKSK